MDGWVSEKFRSLVADHIGVDEARVEPNTQLFTGLGLGWDDVGRLITFLAREFNIPEHLFRREQINTVGDLLAVIEGETIRVGHSNNGATNPADSASKIS